MRIWRRNCPADSDNYQLLSAEQWVAAANITAAKQALSLVSPQARTRLATPRALVAAEIAYAENDPTRAIRELDQIPVPTMPIRRKTTTGSAAAAHFSPAIRSKARAPSSSANAT